MKVRIVYDGDCPFCNDYVAYQRLREAGAELELVDARSRPQVLAALGLTARDLEDGMVVYVGDARHDGADAMFALSGLSQPPARAWVRAVAWSTSSRRRARWLYPWFKLGRRIALRLLGIRRFGV
jgi:predicted DCC family thiol-disulfide oxidoreductase YuxK